MEHLWHFIAEEQVAKRYNDRGKHLHGLSVGGILIAGRTNFPTGQGSDFAQVVGRNDGGLLHSLRYRLHRQCQFAYLSLTALYAGIILYD